MQFNYHQCVGKSIRVSYVDNDIDIYLGELMHHTITPNKHWRWLETKPHELLLVVKNIKFKTKEEAADFLYLLHTTSEKYKESNPLPDDIRTYLVNRANTLYNEKQNILRMLYSIQAEQQFLTKLAEQNKIERILWSTDSSDIKTTIEKLLDFKIKIKKKEVQLFSEAALYHLIGKDDARTVLALLRNVVSIAAPDIEM